MAFYQVLFLGNLQSITGIKRSLNVSTVLDLQLQIVRTPPPRIKKKQKQLTDTAVGLPWQERGSENQRKAGGSGLAISANQPTDFNLTFPVCHSAFSL